MAVIEFINGKKNKNGEKKTYKTISSVKRLINYVLRLDKTMEALKGGIYCNPNIAYEEFILTKSLYNKLPATVTEKSKSDQVIHFTQSFKIEEVTPELAKKIADELLECDVFKGFQIVYATHIDTKHCHTHFAINSVNYENGLRWHISANDLQRIKDYSDELCRKYELSVIPKKEISNETSRTRTQMTSGEYRARRDGRSWKAEILHAGLEVRKVAKNKEEFINMMNSFGYQVRWEESRKDITYTTPQGKKINSDKLGFPDRSYTPLTKEALEKQFALNKQVKENNNLSVVESQEKRKQSLLKLAETLSSDKNTPQYPFQKAWKEGHLEGQALKEKLIELEKGKGLDWERD